MVMGREAMAALLSSVTLIARRRRDVGDMVYGRGVVCEAAAIIAISGEGSGFAGASGVGGRYREKEDRTFPDVNA